MKPCLVCGTPTRRTRCPTHEAEYQAKRNASPQRAKYAGGWAKLSRKTIATHRAIYGDVCPGYQVPPHQVDPHEWTTDHHLGALCRSCNSRKGAVHDRDGNR